MKKNKQPLQLLNIFLGFLANALFVFTIFVLIRLKPKMVNFEPLTQFEEGLLTTIGFGLLLIMLFYFFSLWQFLRHVKHANTIKPMPVFLIIIGVLSLLFVFSDVALLSDIHKQYRHDLSQPEWTLVFPIIILQFIIALLFLFTHLTGRYTVKEEDQVFRDSNIFVVVQYVGVICGLMGLGLAGLGFIYSRGWNLTTHSVLGGLVILFPYGLALLYWLMIKIREKDRQWLDEKQSDDVGKSAFFTLTINTILLLIVFIANFLNLGGVIRMLWLPIDLFSTILLFSLGNIFFSSKT